MKRSRFTEEQIIGILREQETGAKGADLRRQYGMSKASLYNWKAKFGGMEVSGAKRLKALEDENAELKKRLGERCSMLRPCASFWQKMVGSAAKREAVPHLRAALGLSERRACHLIAADGTMTRCRSFRPRKSSHPNRSRSGTRSR